jgi:hypothetical protein
MSLKNKMNIVTIRTNAYNLHNEITRRTNAKTPWDEQIWKLCDTKEVEDEHRSLLICPTFNTMLSMCYMLCMTSFSVCYVASGAQRGLRGAKNFLLPWEMCRIFSLFFTSPRFSCPLLGGFSAHGFCQWFSISG